MLHSLELELRPVGGEPFARDARLPPAETRVQIRKGYTPRTTIEADDGAHAVREVTIGRKSFLELPMLLVQRPYADALFGEMLWPTNWPKGKARKSIEVRSYDSAYRGPVVIAASNSAAQGWRKEPQFAFLEAPMKRSELFYATLGVVNLVDVRPFRLRRDDEAGWCSPPLNSMAWHVEPVGLLPNWSLPAVCARCLDLADDVPAFKRHQQSQHVRMLTARLPRTPDLLRLLGRAGGA
jgi:hypothetical protein